MRFEWYLAYRFLKGSGEEKSVSLMLKLCFTALALGSFALALVLSIAHGFEQATHDKIKGIHADGFIQAHGKPLNYNKIEQILISEYKDSVAALSPSDSEQVIVTKENAETVGQSALLKGIDPASLGTISTLVSLIKTQNSCRSEKQLFSADGIILGGALASALAVTIGEKVTVLYAEHTNSPANSTKRINFDSVTFTVTGLVSTGIEEIDEQLALCSRATFNDALGRTSVTEIGFSFTPAGKSNEGATLAALKKRFTGLEVGSWKDLYKPLVAALALERYALTLILFLICLLASMNITSLLSLYMYRKRKQSAICLAMGMSNAQVRSVFIALGTTLAVSASATGTLAAFAVALFLRSYPLITLPDAYYLTTLPLDLDPRLFIGVFCVTGGLGFLISLLPTRTLTHLPLGTILKREE